MKHLILLLSLFVNVGCYNKRAPQTTGKEGQAMPSFKLLLLDSSSHLDTKNIPSGTPTVLFFFGPHCPYSRAEIKEITKNIETLKNIHFYIFTNWPFHEVKQFYQHFNLDKYDNITVGIDQKYFFVNYFGAKGVPYLAIYNKEKKLNHAFVGMIYSKQIKEIAFN